MPKYHTDITAKILDAEGNLVVTVLSMDRDPFNFGCEIKICTEAETAIVDAFALIRAIRACSGIGSED